MVSTHGNLSTDTPPYTKHASMSTAETRGLSIRWRDRVPGEVLVVKMMLLRGFGAHITNKSLEKPHSMSGTLTSTAYKNTHM